MFDNEDSHKGSGSGSFFGRMILCVAALSLGYILLFMSPEDYRKTLQAEITAFKTTVGEKDARDVLSLSNSIYSYAFVKSQVVPGLEGLLETTGLNGENLWRLPLVRVIENLKLIFYQTSYRLSVFLHWLMFGLPLFIVMALDGYYERRKKQYEFGVTSANYFRIWVKAGGLAFLIIDIYFIFPAAGIFGALLPPLMFFLLGLSIRYTISNISKIF